MIHGWILIAVNMLFTSVLLQLETSGSPSLPTLLIAGYSVLCSAIIYLIAWIRKISSKQNEIYETLIKEAALREVQTREATIRHTETVNRNNELTEKSVDATRALELTIKFLRKEIRNLFTKNRTDDDDDNLH